MKFAKELENEAVPEWRIKYLEYKQGKKKIKAIQKALRNLNRTPATPARPALISAHESERIPFTHYDFSRPRPTTSRSTRSTRSLPEIEEIAPDQDQVGGGGQQQNPRRPGAPRQESETWFAQSPPILVPGTNSENESAATSPETTPLYGRGGGGQTQRASQRPRQMNYGSIVGTPPEETPGQFAALELPDPALSPAMTRKERGAIEPSQPPTPQAPPSPAPRLPEVAAQVPPASDPYHVGETTPPTRRSFRGSLAKTMFKNRAMGKFGKSQSVSLAQPHTHPRSRLRRLFSAQTLDGDTVNDVQLSAYRELDARQAEFFAFLDSELDKIEGFYKMKEDEAVARLHVLRSQLHEMRDRRLAEILKENSKKDSAMQPHADLALAATNSSKPSNKENGTSNGHASNLIKKPLGEALGRRTTIGKTSQAMQQLSSPPGPKAQKRITDANQDYVRHSHGNDVPYRFAKRRLKLALQEYYRGLELLKSYALLNRTGFRKINKKYDKAVQARPTLRYMSEKVNDAYFVRSEVVDNLLTAVEDLYGRYFERGNHKMAVRKLRSKLGPGDQSGTTFRNGIYVAAGVCFGVAGLVDAAHRLHDADPTVVTNTSYLLQLYAGYFLALLLFLLFCLDCRIWTMSHVNYVFIFEYDTRHVLDWRQVSELPCFFLFLNGLFIYLNFQSSTHDAFYTYWPVLLIGISLVLMALPFKAVYYEARRWWGYSNWRLLFAGLYPVEFRDFFLGDMYCSETYAMAQIEAFFCLYANDWNDPPQCNSNHSRLLGFFTALPAVWRAFQCLRRYHDSGHWFPHLANCAKYMGNILYYMTLSFYRIDRTDRTRAVFITFACVNGVYSSFWDVFMDFSLGNPYAKHPFLRDQLAYKQIWIYYFAMVADVLLRQQWIFYAIFTSDLQHSALMSFFVGLAEVLRRGLWCLFRVENEHCNNVGKFRASRDIPLPYELPESPEVTAGGKPVSPLLDRRTPTTPAEVERPDAATTGVDVERATPTESATFRQRRTPHAPSPVTPSMRALQRVGTAIASAHAQDFEKRRRPETETQQGSPDTVAEDGSSDEDDEDDEGGSGSGGEAEVRELQRQRQEEMDEREVTEAQRMVSRARDGGR